MFDFSPSPIDTKEENLVKTDTISGVEADYEMNLKVTQSAQLKVEPGLTPIKEKE
jgi:hypothetical protein